MATFARSIARGCTTFSMVNRSRPLNMRHLSVHPSTQRSTPQSSYLTRFSITEKGLQDTDKASTTLHYESRHMCMCEKCWSKPSNQKISPYAGDTNVKIIHIDPYNEHYIRLKWDDGHEGLFAITDKGSYGNGVIAAPDEYLHKVSMRKNKNQKFWGGPIEEVTEMFDYNDLITDDTRLRLFLGHFMKYGLALINNTPTEKGIATIIEEMKCGPIWETKFGAFDTVSYRANPTNQAYGSHYLAPHIDLPYYTQPPSAYFFYCVANEFDGGESIWVDSFHIIDELRKEKPEYFEVLTTVETSFRSFSPTPGWHLAGSYPTIEMNKNDIHRVRDLFFARDSYQMVKDLDVETREKWWEAYTYFRREIDNPERHVTLKMQAGDLAIIDNWRVFHGRYGFKVDAEDMGKRRVMHSVYVDWNHLQSRMLLQQ